jgi:hypothetical protein
MREFKRLHEERMAAWAYLQSQEFRDKIATDILKEVSPDNPPWETDDEP